jgi:hypothetical protein
MTPYQPAFLVGDRVRIAEGQQLESFRLHWKLHHPLQAEQLPHAGRMATIARVGIYHGGDVIYELVEAPGTWHEDCLAKAPTTL